MKKKKKRTTIFPELTTFFSIISYFVQSSYDKLCYVCVREQRDGPKEDRQTSSHKTSRENKLHNLDQDNLVSDLYLSSLFIWWGQCWMEATVLYVNSVSPLMNSKRGKGNSAGGELVTANTWSPLSHASSLHSLGHNTVLKWGKCPYPHMWGKLQTATRDRLQNGGKEAWGWITKLKQLRDTRGTNISNCVYVWHDDASLFFV